MNNYHLFFDESGTSSLKNIDPNFPILVLTGLLISDESYEILKEKIAKLKEKYFPNKKVVLHRRDMRKYERGFEIFFDDSVKKSFYHDLNKVLSESDYVLISSAIDKIKHIKQYGKLADDPYQIALTFVMERVIFEKSVKDISSIKTTVESRGRKEDSVIVSRYNQLLYRGSYQVEAVRFRDLFVEDLSVVDKNYGEIGIEITDLCAYPIARHILHNSEPNIAYDIIKSKIRCGPRGQIQGYGVKVFPE